MNDVPPTAEFSRHVRLAELPEGGREFRFEAGPEERDAVARRLGLLGLERLEARVSVVREGNLVRAGGVVEAVVVQECVVTLEPVTGPVTAYLEQAYVARDPGDMGQADIQVDALAEDPPEPLVRGGMDLGELVVEYLALALDPYPRKPGAHVDMPHEVAEERSNPFAKLRDLKNSATDK